MKNFKDVLSELKESKELVTEAEDVMPSFLEREITNLGKMLSSVKNIKKKDKIYFMEKAKPAQRRKLLKLSKELSKVYIDIMNP